MISDEDFKFLLYESRNSYKILEIGTGTGKSTAALVANRATVYTIDRNNIFTHFGLDHNVHRFICESQTYWQEHNHKDFDFVFVDASIGLGDCQEILKRTKDTFSIVFHDYLPGNKNKNENKGEYNMKYFKKSALENYNITQRTGGSHCAILDLNKDK
jgi:predicted O-methyltransferase YrrM